MDYEQKSPPGRPITGDPYFTLMAGDDGVGFVCCGDGVLVLPLNGDGRVLLAVERAPPLPRICWVSSVARSRSGSPWPRRQGRTEASREHAPVRTQAG